MKHTFTLKQCVQRAKQLGFRDAALGGSFLVWALNCASTDIDAYLAELVRNRPSLFDRETRRRPGQ